MTTRAPGVLKSSSMRWRVLGSHYGNEGISSWRSVIFSKAIQLQFSVAFSQQFRCIKRSDFFFSMFLFYKQEMDYKLFKRMNEVKLSCVLLGIVWRKEEGRSKIEIPSKRLFLRYFPSHGLDWLIIKAWGSLFLDMCMYSIRISHHSMLSQGLPLTHEYE